MSEFKRKSQTSGFEAGEGKFEAIESTEATGPDFGALEVESGFSVDQVEDSIRRVEQVLEPEPATEKSAGFEIDRAKSVPAPTPAEPAAEKPTKKRYYNPGEVMQKKGCIGCGGMALAVPVMLAILALAIAIF